MAAGRGGGGLALPISTARPKNSSSRGLCRRRCSALFGACQSCGSDNPELVGGGSEEKEVMEELSLLLEEIQSEEAQQGHSSDPAVSVQIPSEANVWADLYERYSLYCSFISIRSTQFRPHGCDVRRSKKGRGRCALYASGSSQPWQQGFSGKANLLGHLEIPAILLLITFLFDELCSIHCCCTTSVEADFCTCTARMGVISSQILLASYF